MLRGFDWRRIALLRSPIQGDNGSAGLGAPDFPGNSGDREAGKFRDSQFPRFDTVAVANDDGSNVTALTDQLLAQILAELKTNNTYTVLMLSKLGVNVSPGL